MFKIKKHAFIIIALTIIFGITPGCNIKSTYTQATWVESFKTIDEMISSADLIVVGKSVGALTEQRKNLVFTREIIEIKEVIKGNERVGNKIHVLQTGGRKGDIYTPPISDAPLLTKNDQYLLCLRVTDQGYYLILGGYQGIGKLDSKGRITTLARKEANRFLDGKEIKDIKEKVK